MPNFSVPETWNISDEEAMRDLGASLGPRFQAGDVVFLEGELGAGKTTLVRGLLTSLGWTHDVRSPTFNLLHTYPDLTPPVVHADLYRVSSWQGIGLEDYLDDYLVLIEWADRAVGLVALDSVWRLKIEFVDTGRLVTLQVPTTRGRVEMTQ
jgi:tRNA threonylcarbamoyladenosine biosynthesis protein TsaE